MSTELVERVRRRLASSGAGLDAAPVPGLGRVLDTGAVAAAVRAEAGGVVGHADVLDALRLLRHEFVGAGPLEPLLADPGTTDVLVTGPHEVWVDGPRGLRRTEVAFPDEDTVRRLAQRLALAAGRRLDDAQPYVDGWLPGAGPHGRIRLHAVLPPIAAAGTCVSLRVLRPASHDLATLRSMGTFDESVESLLRGLVACRLAFLVSGSTGSGKSTLLGALLGTVPPGERIVCVEDAGELQPAHPQFVRLIARPANVEGAGEITLRDLVRQALRMRPDRIVVGEVRGREVCELLTALNTGHQGGAGTVHANSPAEVPARLEALAALGGLSRSALHSQLAAAVHVVLHMRRGPGGLRRLREIGVVCREAADVHVRPVWRDGRWTGHRALLTELFQARGVNSC
jgi:pilus assembly protein CpaF